MKLNSTIVDTENYLHGGRNVNIPEGITGVNAVEMTEVTTEVADEVDTGYQNEKVNFDIEGTQDSTKIVDIEVKGTEELDPSMEYISDHLDNAVASAGVTETEVRADGTIDDSEGDNDGDSEDDSEDDNIAHRICLTHGLEFLMPFESRWMRPRDFPTAEDAGAFLEELLEKWESYQQQAKSARVSLKGSQSSQQSAECCATLAERVSTVTKKVPFEYKGKLQDFYLVHWKNSWTSDIPESALKNTNIFDEIE